VVEATFGVTVDPALEAPVDCDAADVTAEDEAVVAEFVVVAAFLLADEVVFVVEAVDVVLAVDAVVTAAVLAGDEVVTVAVVLAGVLAEDPKAAPEDADVAAAES